MHLRFVLSRGGFGGVIFQGVVEEAGEDEHDPERDETEDAGEGVELPDVDENEAGEGDEENAESGVTIGALAPEETERDCGGCEA